MCTGGNSCCTTSNKCGDGMWEFYDSPLSSSTCPGQGDCDYDNQCLTNHKCGINNCRSMANRMGGNASKFDTTDGEAEIFANQHFKNQFSVNNILWTNFPKWLLLQSNQIFERLWHVFFLVLLYIFERQTDLKGKYQKKKYGFLCSFCSKKTRFGPTF